MKEGFKSKLSHELKELLSVFFFLAPFFCAFVTYRMLLLNEFELAYFYYGSALASALVLSKVILLGEYAHLGRRQENRPLIVSTLYKSLLFGLLAAAFRIAEEAVKQLLFRKGPFHPLGGLDTDELLARALIMFCAFIPFFALREIARVLGEGRLFGLFFGGRTDAESAPSGRPSGETRESRK
jgi:hypothetical protein